VGYVGTLYLVQYLVYGEKDRREKEIEEIEKKEKMLVEEIYFFYRKINIVSDQILRHLMGSFSVALISINARS
jgi:hypothetical protein